jgi:ABC-2 type transport system permease protein
VSAPGSLAPASAGSQALSWACSLRLFFVHGLRLAFQGKRTLVLALALSVPILLALARAFVLRVPRGLASADEILVNFTLLAYLQVLMPLVCLLLGTSVVSEEWEGRTLGYLFTRPVRKASLVVGKGIAMWLVSAVLLAASFLATAAIVSAKRLPTDFQKHPDLAAGLLGILLLSTLPYTAIFVFLGTVLRRPLIPGLVFAFGLEGFLRYVPLGIQKLTVAHYALSLAIPYADVSSVLRGLVRGPLSAVEQPGPAVAIAWLAGLTLVFGALAAWVVGRREYLAGKPE